MGELGTIPEINVILLVAWPPVILEEDDAGFS